MRRSGAFTLVELLVVITIIGILIALLLPAVQAAREAGRRAQCVNNVKQLCLAVHTYAERHAEMLPRGVEFTRGRYCCCDPGDWCMGHTIHTVLLPYIEQQPLYDRYDMKIPYFAQTPGIIDQPIAAYKCPSAITWEKSSASQGSCPSWSGTVPNPRTQVYPHNYPAAGSEHGYGGCGRHNPNTDYNGVFAMRRGMDLVQESDGGPYTQGPPRIRLAAVTDGTSNTMAFSENAQRRPSWTDSGAVDAGLNRGWGDPYYESTLFSINRKATPNSILGGYQSRNLATVSSWHPGGVNVGFLDGSVRFVSDSITGDMWWYLGTPGRGETVSLP